jgi:hypothetical protein
MCKTCNLGNIMNRRRTSSKTNPMDSILGSVVGAGITIGVDQAVDMLAPGVNESIKAAAPAIAGIGVSMLMPNLVKGKTAQGAVNAAVAIGVYRLASGLMASGLVSGYETVGLGYPLSVNNDGADEDPSLA